MSFLFPNPSPPPPPPVEPTPVTRDDPAVEEARRKERDAARLRLGRAATILTSGAGLAGTGPVTRKRLLGE